MHAEAFLIRYEPIDNLTLVPFILRCFASFSEERGGGGRAFVVFHSIVEQQATSREEALLLTVKIPEIFLL